MTLPAVIPGILVGALVRRRCYRSAFTVFLLTLSCAAHADDLSDSLAELEALMEQVEQQHAEEAPPPPAEDAEAPDGDGGAAGDGGGTVGPADGGSEQ